MINIEKTYPIGRKIDYDGHYGYQCFDFANQYHLDLTSFKPKIQLLKASDIWHNPQGFFAENVEFEKITNQPNNFPVYGDLIVWNGNFGKGFGHVAVVLRADKNSLTVREQDGFDQVGIKETTYNYNNILGWFRFKNFAQNPNLDPKIFTIRGQNEWISSLLKRVGFDDYDKEFRWQYLADLNGYKSWQVLNNDISTFGKILRIRPENTINDFKQSTQTQENSNQKEDLEVLQKQLDLANEENRQIREISQRQNDVIESQDQKISELAENLAKINQKQVDKNQANSEKFEEFQSQSFNQNSDQRKEKIHRVANNFKDFSQNLERFEIKEETETKKWYKSKIFWLGIISGFTFYISQILLIPEVQAILPENIINHLILFTVLAIPALRVFEKKHLKLTT